MEVSYCFLTELYLYSTDCPLNIVFVFVHVCLLHMNVGVY